MHDDKDPNHDKYQHQHRQDAAIITCRIESEPLTLERLRTDLPDLPGCGGYVCFEGLVRNINHGKTVIRLEYEAYASLATKELEQICKEAATRFGLEFVRAVHREGSLAIGDAAVIVQVLSRHRAEAFEGCSYVIDQLKARVPIWKKEHYDDGSSEWTRCHHHEQHS